MKRRTTPFSWAVSEVPVVKSRRISTRLLQFRNVFRSTGYRNPFIPPLIQAPMHSEGLTSVEEYEKMLLGKRLADNYHAGIKPIKLGDKKIDDSDWTYAVSMPKGMRSADAREKMMDAIRQAQARNAGISEEKYKMLEKAKKIDEWRKLDVKNEKVKQWISESLDMDNHPGFIIPTEQREEIENYIKLLPNGEEKDKMIAQLEQYKEYLKGVKKIGAEPVSNKTSKSREDVAKDQQAKKDQLKEEYKEAVDNMHNGDSAKAVKEAFPDLVEPAADQDAPNLNLPGDNAANVGGLNLKPPSKGVGVEPLSTSNQEIELVKGFKLTNNMGVNEIKDLVKHIDKDMYNKTIATNPVKDDWDADIAKLITDGKLDAAVLQYFNASNKKIVLQKLGVH